jgi:hypothetical protein
VHFITGIRRIICFIMTSRMFLDKQGLEKPSNAIDTLLVDSHKHPTPMPPKTSLQGSDHHHHHKDERTVPDTGHHHHHHHHPIIKHEEDNLLRPSSLANLLCMMQDGGSIAPPEAATTKTNSNNRRKKRPTTTTITAHNNNNDKVDAGNNNISSAINGRSTTSSPPLSSIPTTTTKKATDGAPTTTTTTTTNETNIITTKPPRRKTAHFVGVRRRQWGTYAAEVRNQLTGCREWLGTFSSQEEAAVVYDTRLRQLKGPQAKCNFPPLDYSGAQVVRVIYPHGKSGPDKLQLKIPADWLQQVEALKLSGVLDAKQRAVIIKEQQQPVQPSTSVNAPAVQKTKATKKRSSTRPISIPQKARAAAINAIGVGMHSGPPLLSSTSLPLPMAAFSAPATLPPYLTMLQPSSSSLGAQPLVVLPPPPPLNLNSHPQHP